MDETTDDCSQSVVNTLFAFHQHTKLVSVDFLKYVNNSTIEGILLSILSYYNIPYTLPRLFLSDSCCAHIINLIGDT
ncbi:hypothetical protein C1645_840806 [Glomus cerebriforme]|uniref:DUF659 domain-containing protein n=1 Tax=Glomus cerebriforme TaxID=658196 RepID=A0A397S0D1_9GLOM|nr:hypothetical protein C1645_840806 [Glomus cerebriforme]